MQQSEQMHQDDHTDPDLLPFVAPSNKLPLWAAFGWLKLTEKPISLARHRIGVVLLVGSLVLAPLATSAALRVAED